MKAVQSAIGSVLRNAGQGLDVIGRNLELHPYIETCT